MKNLYAVYGSLRQGLHNNSFLQKKGCTLLGTERTKPKFKMVSLGGFPGVILDGIDSIVVEVYEVDNPKVDESLDRLESYPHFYDKTRIRTKWGMANMYILDEKRFGEYDQVPGGDWKEHLEQMIDDSNYAAQFVEEDEEDV